MFILKVQISDKTTATCVYLLSTTANFFQILLKQIRTEYPQTM